MRSKEWFFRKTYPLAKLLNIFQMDTILGWLFSTGKEIIYHVVTTNNYEGEYHRNFMAVNFTAIKFGGFKGVS